MVLAVVAVLVEAETVPALLTRVVRVFVGFFGRTVQTVQFLACLFEGGLHYGVHVIGITLIDIFKGKNVEFHNGVCLFNSKVSKERAKPSEKFTQSPWHGQTSTTFRSRRP